MGTRVRGTNIQSRGRNIQPATPDRPSTMGKQVGEVTEEPIPDYDDSVTEDSEVTTQYGFPNEPMASAPVHLTSPPPISRIYKTWTTGKATLSTQPLNISSSERRRTRLVVRNVNELENVYLSTDELTPEFGAFELPPGERETFYHTERIYAFGANSETPIVTWFAEYDVDEPET